MHEMSSREKAKQFYTEKLEDAFEIVRNIRSDEFGSVLDKDLILVRSVFHDLVKNKKMK